MFKTLIKILSRIVEILLDILAQLRNQNTPQLPEDYYEEMSRLQVIKYLGIHERTYIRKVKDGKLKPRKMAGGDRFYKRDLTEAYKESIRRGASMVSYSCA